MSATHSVPDASLPPPSLEEVSPGVFAYIQLDGSWFLNNAGFITGEQATVAIDTLGTERRSRAFFEAIARTSDKPLRTLVSTHSHADHTHGNYLAPAGTTIVGHELCREEMLAANLEALKMSFPTADFGDVEYAPPTVTFADRITLYSDDLRVELIHFGPAHTTNDVVAWLPDRKVLFAGDLAFNGGTPFAMAGSVAGWLDVIPELRALPATTIVPGHGPVCGPEVFDTVEAYLTFVMELARRGREEGVAPLDLARATDLGDFAGLLDRERLVGNLHRAYAELSGLPRGGPIDVPSVFADMISYNGGEPLRCLA
ncbi:MAG: MBL fold metallo-hydrolase [Dehalococcoidia bacterium]